MDKQGKKGGLVSILFTVLVVAVYLVPNLAQAVNVTVTTDKTEYGPADTQVQANLTVVIAENERIPIQNLKLMIDGVPYCPFDINGMPLTSCPGVVITPLSSGSSGTGPLNGTDESTTTFVQFGAGFGYGYGYGYGADSGITGTLAYSVTIDTALLGAAGHSLGLEVNAVGTDASHTFSDITSFNVVGIIDTDADGIADDVDNCPTTANANQTDSDADEIGDACDVTCGLDVECYDANPYTEDTCIDPATVSSSCSYQSIACIVDTDCDDMDVFTADICDSPATVSSSCSYQDITCIVDTDCDDTNTSTEDICLNAGTTLSSCLNQEIIVGNEPPTAPMVDLLPNVAYATTNLTCNITEPSTDTEGDPITYTYQWYRNGVLQSSLATDTVLSSKTLKSDIWECIVLPSDGNVHEDGTVYGLSASDATFIFNSPTEITSFTPVSLTPTVAEGSTLSFSITATDPDAPLVYSWQLDNVEVSTESSFNYTPTITGAGLHTVLVTVSDGELPKTLAWTVTVTNVNQAPALTVAATKTCAEDSLCTLTATATDADADDVLRFSDNTTLFSIGTSTGVIGFTPTQSKVGAYPVKIAVEDGKGGIDSKTVVFAINNVNDAPVIKTIGTLTAIQDLLFNVDVNATDEDQDALTYSLTESPSGMIINAASGLISWTPTSGQIGVNFVNVSVSDGTATASEFFAVVVTDVNDAPVVNSFTPTTDPTIAEPDSQAFTITASDPDGGTPSVKWYLNNKLLSEASDTYTFAGSYTSAGTYAIKAEATDGQYTAQKTWTLTVTNTNRPPVLTAPSNATCTEDSLCTIAINATDPDTDNVLVYSDNSPLFATGLLTGKISFIPTQANVGSHSILFKVADGTAAVTRTTTLTITNVNDAPVLATIGSRTLIEGGSYSIQAAATDEDGNTLNYSLTNAPSGMKVNATTGLIKWSPTFQNSGTYNVLVKVSDGALSDSEDVVFTVLNANQAPTITSTTPAQSVTMKEDNATRFTLTASDPDGTALTTKWYKNGVLMAGEMSTSFTFQGVFTDEGTNAGNYSIKGEVTDGIATASYTWALSVTRTRDADKDTIPDYRDNCGLVYNQAQTDSDANGIGDACQGNVDGDDVADEEDFVAGSKDNIETNVQNMEFTISGSDDINQVVTETQPVALTETTYDEATGQATTESVVEFEFNFASSTTLDLGELKIEKQTSGDAGSIVIKGLDLTSQGKTKSAFIDKLAGNDYVCIMDAEIASISELTSDCSGANEFSLKCDGVTREGYTCTDTGTKYKIEGLVHSGVQESSVADTDGDGVLDDVDNCISTANANQADSDTDGMGNVCDNDADGDGSASNVDCNDNAATVHPGAAETCNNVDDDCDGQTDESLTRQYGATNVGACEFGTERCSAGVWGITTAAIAPATDILNNGIDEDCDGKDDQCNAANSCAPTECDNLDTCIANDYSDYNDVSNACVNEVCQTNSCGAPETTANDARCTECRTDNDCNKLDKDYCSASLIKRDEGKCVNYACQTQTTTTKNCGVDDHLTTNYCNAENNNVYKDSVAYACDAATITCKETKTPQLIEDCIDGCTNGACLLNTAPVITSTPVTAATEGAKYTYQVIAADAQQTKLWYSDNSPLFNINSLTGKIEFTPAKANAGAHQIIITVSDGWLTASQTYTLTINPINGPPVLASIGALSAREGELFTTTVTAADPEKAALTFSDNADLFDINPSTGLISFTPAAADVGAHAVIITVSDGALTDSEALAFTVLAKETVNTVPSITAFTPENNPAITELQQQTFTVTATDKESTPGILWYVGGSVVGSGNSYTFVGDNSMENSNAGVYAVKAVASDGELKDEKTWTLTVTRVKDTDGDEVADAADNCVFVANADQLDSDSNGIGNACQGNVDGDSVKDEEDFVDGTADVVDTNVQLSLTIAGEENLNKVITGTQPVTFTSTVVDAVTKEVKAEPIVNFQFDFTQQTKLDLSKIEIKKQPPEAPAGEVIVKGIDLTAQGKTKTVYMDKIAGTNTVCIKDAEIASLKEISGECSGANEHLLACDGVTRESYTCTIEGAKYKIGGLKHSGAIESRPNSAPQAVITTSSQTVAAGNTLQLSGFATDPDGDAIATHEWDFSSYDNRKQGVIFVTRYAYAPGALGGLAGADEKCQIEADEAGLLGTYQAFLSATDFGDRCALQKTANNRMNLFSDYYMVDGLRVGSLATPQAVINKAANGNIIPGEKILSFTGNDYCAVAGDDQVQTSKNGQLHLCQSSRDCHDWTQPETYVWDADPLCTSNKVPQSVPTGVIGSTGPTRAYNFATCSEAVHLYCVQTGNVQTGGIIQQQTPTVKLTKPGTYTFTYRVKDARNGIGTSAVTIKVAGKVANTHVAKGWNEVQLGVTPKDTAIEKVLAAMKGQYDAVWTYKNGQWLSYSPDVLPLTSTLKNADGTTKLYINAKQDATLSVAGTVPSGSGTTSSFSVPLSAAKVATIVDFDGDSYTSNDCNPYDASQGAGTAYYADSDGDGYGAAASSLQSCSVQAGYVTNNLDCSDTNFNVHAVSTYYYDADADGYGTAASVSSCGPSGYYTATKAGDACDAVYGKLAPITYYYDEDSDGRGTSASIQSCSPSGYYKATQSGDSCDTTAGTFAPGTYYRDADGDGYGSTAVQLCGQQSGYVAKGGDLRDNDAASYPGASERCDNVDNNYNGQVDESLTRSSGSNIGSCQLRTETCSSGSWVVTNAGVSPASEACDGHDNNCDGRIDEGFPSQTYYYDYDGDGYGIGYQLVNGCSATGYYRATQAGDCSDNNPNVRPGAGEICDGADNDCDGRVDEDLTRTASCGTGACGNTITQTCSYGQWVGSCNVGTPSGETCDGVDNDCDGRVDEDLTKTVSCGVGACARTGTQSCSYGQWAGSCTPGAPVQEVQNGVDDNCDGSVDNGLTKTAAINVVSGWNTVTLPFTPADTSVASVLGSISGKYNAVWALKNGQWLSYSPTVLPATNSLKYIDSSMTLYISMTQSGTLTITG